MAREPRSKAGTHERIYAAVRTIPRGRVSTYGSVARLAGLSGQARLVGYALAALRDGTAVPWHRVINAQGKLSLERAGASSGTTQRLRLAREGVTVDAAGRVSLARFGWKLTTGRDRRQSTHREDSDSSHSADEKHRPRAKASRSKRRSDNALDA